MYSYHLIIPVNLDFSFSKIMASGLSVSGFFSLLALLAVCEARPMSMLQDQYSSSLTSPIFMARELTSGCTAWDIKVSQGQASSVGLPTWDVHITNTCVDARCSISDVVVQCGQFHSASLVNPAKFRRLDASQGTCIVKKGGVVGNGETVAFKYQENFLQPLQLKSAKVSCSG